MFTTHKQLGGVLALLGVLGSSGALALPMRQPMVGSAPRIEKAACWWVQGAWGPQQVCRQEHDDDYGDGHYDYHRGHWDRHYDHYDYHPGHWDYHHNGHRDHLEEY